MEEQGWDDQGQLGVNNEGRQHGSNGEDRNVDTDSDSLAAAWAEINFKWCNQSFVKFLLGWRR